MDKNELEKRSKDIQNPLITTAFVTAEAVQKRFKEVLGEKAQSFTASLVSAIQTNPELQKCERQSVINAALIAASLDLPINQNLGFAYIIGYKNTKLTKKYGRDVSVASFQLGYKGFVQLALRTGQYETVNAVEIKKGEYQGQDRLRGGVHFRFIEDDEEREALPTVGYAAIIELKTGYSKTIYWSKKKMEIHAKKYSQAYKADIKWNNKKSFWMQDFDSQGMKTVLKTLISKWGIMTTELETAISVDQSVIDDKGKIGFPDNDQKILIGQNYDDDKTEKSTVKKTAKKTDTKPKKTNTKTVTKNNEIKADPKTGEIQMSLDDLSAAEIEAEMDRISVEIQASQKKEVEGIGTGRKRGSLK